MDSGKSAIRIILIMGLGAFLLLVLVSFGLRRSLQPNALEKVRARQIAGSPFLADRAMNDLRAILDFGPRLPGSPAAVQTRAYLATELAKAGLRVWDQPFEFAAAHGSLKMANLVAEIEGTRPGTIVFGAHYDTKDVPGQILPGANDGGAATAWLLEWARALGPRREGRSIWLVWFDGNEASGDAPHGQALRGSRAFVKLLRDRGDLPQVQAMVALDMIGDCYLNLQGDPGAPAWLAGTIWDTAGRRNYDSHFSKLKKAFQSDHLPFREAGVPAVLLVDALYGGTIIEHDKNMHTPRDAFDKVCPESLQAIADVLYHALPSIDGRLETQGTPLS